ncbi:MAG: ABC transporter permease [Actinomycetales bacterium]|nr:ABC transporter permease [Actinomycetales bacterium]
MAEASAVGSRSRTPYLLLLPGMAWLAVFFVVPLVSLLMQSVQTPLPGGLPGQYEQTFRFANFVDVLSRTEFLGALGRSFLFALLATVAALLIAYPLAYAIALRAGRAKPLFLVLVVAPFFVSFVLRTIAWRQILGAEGPVVGALQALHLVPSNFSIYPSSLAVIAGLTYNFLPFMTLPIYASLDRMDTRLIEAAQDLYSSSWTAFRKVTLPISMPGVVAGTLLTFIPASGDYINAQLLGNATTTMVGNVVDSRFLVNSDYPTASVLSFTLMAIILAMVFVYVRRAGTEELV